MKTINKKLEGWIQLIVSRSFIVGRKYLQIHLFLLVVFLHKISLYGQVNIGFTTPDTVCVNTPVEITNTTTGATNYYWNFCVADISNTVPIASNLGNLGGAFSNPVFIDYVFDNNNYYGFTINYNPGNLIRLDFGNSLLNTPTAVSLGNFGGAIPPGSGAEGIQVIKNEGKWYAIIVGGYTPSGSTPRILKIDFGANLTNTLPLATNWGNIGNLSQPIDLHVFSEGNTWYGFTVNAENNTITRFNFSSSFDNFPTAINLGNIGNLSYPTGIYAIDDNGFWRVFIVNGGVNSNTSTSGVYSLTRLDFGNSLLNLPVGINLGNPGNALQHPRDLTIMKSCDEIIGFVVNGNSSYNNLVKMNFNNNLSSTPILSSLGNIGNLNFPHSISKLFRVNNDLYSFITNVANNTLTRLRFTGCSNASIPNSNLRNPPAIIYNVPGVFNINLTIDEGLPTQSSFCRNVVVVAPSKAELQHKTACKGDTIILQSNVSSSSYLWNTGSVSSSAKVTNSGTYWVEYNKFNCTARDSFLVEFKDLPRIQARSDTSICNGDSVRLLLNNQSDKYKWSSSPEVYNGDVVTSYISPKSTTTYIITADDSLGCTSKDTVTITVLPSPFFTISNDTLICKGDTIQLKVSSNENLQYSWAYSITLDNLTIPNPLAYPVTPTTYYIEVTNSNMCVRKDSVQVSLSLQPDIQLISDTSICEGSSIKLIAKPATNNITVLYGHLP